MITSSHLVPEVAEYHAPALKKVVTPGTMIIQAVLVAVVGSSLGIGVGVLLAGNSMPTGNQQSAKAASTTSPVNAPPVIAASAPAVVAQTAAPVVPAPLPATQVVPSAPVPLVKPAPALAIVHTVKAHKLRLLSATLKVIHHRRRGYRRTASPKKAPAKIDINITKQLAKLEYPDQRFRFTIEGDQTAVDYDSSAGVVATTGNQVFLVEASEPVRRAIRWSDSPSNVHYKCDQDSNCTLTLASAVVQHARLRSHSYQTQDWGFTAPSSAVPPNELTQAPMEMGHVSR